MNTTEFVHELKWEQLPDTVRNQVRRCFLDTIGTAIAARQTALSGIVYDFAATAYAGTGAELWLDGRQVSPPGAALAHGMTIDALDIHDSCLPVKGHAGVALVPAALATLRLNGVTISGQELLATLVMGYEIATRAGKSLHASACDYHTSGAWNALGCAAITARRLGATREQTRHALGIAEYHGPRSQMMRCIDHPTMLKDGSGWGGMTGVSAGLLAHSNFSGAPALTVEAPELSEIWADLGQRWAIMEQAFKPYAVCYWAQAAIAGAVNLQRAHDIRAEEIRSIRVSAFHEATRLTTRHPETTEEAQYSLPFPVAGALVHGRLDYAQLNDAALHDPLILDLAARVELIEDDTFNARFPQERLSRVVIELQDGSTFDSGEVRPLWDVTAPPSDEELRAKFQRLSSARVARTRSDALEQAIWHCAEMPDVSELLSLLTPS